MAVPVFLNCACANRNVVLVGSVKVTSTLSIITTPSFCLTNRTVTLLSLDLQNIVKSNTTPAEIVTPVSTFVAAPVLVLL